MIKIESILTVMDEYSLILYSSLLLLAAILLSSKLWGPDRKTNKLPLPPGNWGWPLIGETMTLLRCNWNGRPQEFIEERMAKHDKQVFKTSIFGERVAVLCGSSGHKFLFSNENKLVVAWWPQAIRNLLTHSILTTSGDEARHIRRNLMVFLKPEALQRYVATMDAVAVRHMESEWIGKHEVNVYSLVKEYTFSIACSLFVSIEDKDYVSRIGKHFKVMLKGIVGLPINLPGTRFYRAKRAAEALRKEIRLIMETRKRDLLNGTASTTQDLLSHLLVTVGEDGRSLSDIQIVDNILALLFAGHDTTCCSIALIMKYLSDSPHFYEEIMKEHIAIVESKKPGELLQWEDIQKMKFSWTFACEVMRLSPPIIGTFREAIADFTYEGFSIPKGWKLYWSPHSSHCNPSYFSEPLKFDPSRFEGEGPAPYTYVPFGGGPRMCPGKEFARLEILVFLHNVVKRYRWKSIFPEEKILVDPMPTPSEGLPITLHPHDNISLT